MDLSLTLIVVVALIKGGTCQYSNLSLPQSIMGVEGSCVLVPCSFKISKTYELQFKLNGCPEQRAVWKRGHMLSSVTRNGDLFGDLKHQNCTTVFNNFTKEENDDYFFRLECNNKLSNTFKESVHISVRPGVTPPHLTSVTLANHVTEGSQVTLQCVAMVPCPFLPPSITWTGAQSRTLEQSQIIQNSDGQKMLKSTLTFTASARHHKQLVTCSVSYPLSAGGSTEAIIASHPLNVLYGPRSTFAKMNVSGPVSEGSVVIFTCSSDANPPVTNYTWIRDTGRTTVRIGEDRTMLLHVRREHSGLYQCHALSKRGAQWSNSLELEVHCHNEKGFGLSVVLWISGVSGVLSTLCIFTVALVCYKYRRVLRKLKHLEQKEEHIYSDLQNNAISPDYDNLQTRPSVRTSAETWVYENAADFKTTKQSKTTKQ